MLRYEGDPGFNKGFGLFLESRKAWVMFRYAEALELLEKACALVQATRGRDHFYVAILRYFEAQAYEKLRQDERAESCLREAWQIRVHDTVCNQATRR